MKILKNILIYFSMVVISFGVGTEVAKPLGLSHETADAQTLKKLDDKKDSILEKRALLSEDVEKTDKQLAQLTLLKTNTKKDKKLIKKDYKALKVQDKKIKKASKKAKKAKKAAAKKKAAKKKAAKERARKAKLKKKKLAKKKTKLKQKKLKAQKAKKAKAAKIKKQQEQAKQESIRKQQEQAKQESIKKQQEEAKQAQIKQQQEQARQESIKQEQAKQQSAAQQTTRPQGDFNTATDGQGQIIGNTRSKIFHVPGQAGYNMNSQNIIRFNSVQEAINAGYRQSKR